MSELLGSPGSISKNVCEAQLMLDLVQLKYRQAGLSRATLKISSEFSSNFSLRTHNSQSIEWLLRYSNYNILRPSSYAGRLHLKDLYNIVWSYKLKFKI